MQAQEKTRIVKIYIWARTRSQKHTARTAEQSSQSQKIGFPTTQAQEKTGIVETHIWARTRSQKHTARTPEQENWFPKRSDLREDPNS